MRRIGIVALGAAFGLLGACGDGPRSATTLRAAGTGKGDGVHLNGQLYCGTIGRVVQAPSLNVRSTPGGAAVVTRLPQGTQLNVDLASGQVAPLGDALYQWKRVTRVLVDGALHAPTAGEQWWIAENGVVEWEQGMYDVDERNVLADCGPRALDLSLLGTEFARPESEVVGLPRDGYLEGCPGDAWCMPHTAAPGWGAVRHDVDKDWAFSGAPGRKAELKWRETVPFQRLQCNQCSFGLEKTFAVQVAGYDRAYRVSVPFAVTRGSGKAGARIGGAAARIDGAPQPEGASYATGFSAIASAVVVVPAGDRSFDVRIWIERDTQSQDLQVDFFDVKIGEDYGEDFAYSRFDAVAARPFDPQRDVTSGPVAASYASGLLPEGWRVVPGNPDVEPDSAWYERRTEVRDGALIMQTKGDSWAVEHTFRDEMGLLGSLVVPFQVLEGAAAQGGRVTVLVHDTAQASCPQPQLGRTVCGSGCCVYQAQATKGTAQWVEMTEMFQALSAALAKRVELRVEAPWGTLTRVAFDGAFFYGSM